VHHLLLLLLLLVMSDLLFMGHPYWFSLRQIGRVNHVRVPVTRHPVRKNYEAFGEFSCRSESSNI